MLALKLLLQPGHRIMHGRGEIIDRLALERDLRPGLADKRPPGWPHRARSARPWRSVDVQPAWGVLGGIRETEGSWVSPGSEPRHHIDEVTECVGGSLIDPVQAGELHWAVHEIYQIRLWISRSRIVRLTIGQGDSDREKFAGTELTLATEADVEAIAALRNAASDHLTAMFGHGHWSLAASAKGMFSNMGRSRIFVARRGATMIATLKLATKKPWAIDTKYFSVCSKPLYLTNMAVHPTQQRKGVGRLCLEEAARIGTAWPADFIRLDAYDATAGAGEFYRRCGFREVGRASYRNTPLIYLELML